MKCKAGGDSKWTGLAETDHPHLLISLTDFIEPLQNSLGIQR